MDSSNCEEGLDQIAHRNQRLSVAVKMYSKSKPLHAVSKADTVYRTVALIAIVFALVSGLLQFRCQNLSQWIAKQAEVVSTRVVEGASNSDVTTHYYSISARLKYKTATGGDHFVERTFAANMPYYDADVNAKKLVGTMVPVRYDPQNVDDCLLEESAAQTDSVMPFVPYIFGVSSITAACFIYLAFGAGRVQKV